MKFIHLILFTFLSIGMAGQSRYTVQGHLPQAPHAEVSLRSFTGLQEAELARTKTDSLGNFSLRYPASYSGAALLVVKDQASVILLLNKENFVIEWKELKDFKDFQVRNSPENAAFGAGLKLYQETEAKLAGLDYIAPFYAKEPQKLKWISTEIRSQNGLFDEFLSQLPEGLYAKTYLKLRKLLSQMPVTANKYIERMPQHELDFNTLDFSEPGILHSGLYKDLFEGYFLLMESHGTEKMYAHVNASTDAVLKSLKDEPNALLEVSEYLFKLFEKRSLFPAAEHLALSMLATEDCTVDKEREALFEQYRKMAVGNTAPEIVFKNQTKFFDKLSEVKSKYRLVVFGSSWCAKCAEEIPKLKNFYAELKTKYDLEIVLVSLDTDKEKYVAFTKDFPWLNSCDFKSWEGEAARAYYIFGTPTMFLLDGAGKILLKPVSADHLNAWMQQLGVANKK